MIGLYIGEGLGGLRLLIATSTLSQQQGLNSEDSMMIVR